jgi:release factor glutamine methyltransferase
VTRFASSLPPEYVDQIRRWHERTYAEELKAGAVEQRFEHLGTTIVVPPQVMPITPMSHLLGEGAA